MAAFVNRVHTLGTEVEMFKITLHEEMAFMLINRYGPGYDSLKHIIDQWSTVDFTYEKVKEALLTEDNRRKFEITLTSKEVKASRAFRAIKQNLKKR